MELRQLAYLEAVLEAGTFTGAAASKHVAQPALWAQVRALEREWGVAMFERVGRRVRPTPAALALRPIVRALLGRAEGLGDEVRRLRTGESGEVRIGSSHYQLSHFLAQAFARHARRWPQTALPTVVAIGTADPYAVLAEGRVDLVSGLDPAAHGFESAPLYEVSVVAVARGLGAGPVDVRSLRERPLAVLRRDFSSRVLLDAACARAGFSPLVVFEDQHADGPLALARSGLATAVVVSEAIAPGFDLPTAVLHERRRPLGGMLHLMWRDEATLSTSARRLRDSIVETAAARREASVSPTRSGRPASGAARRRSRSAGRGR